MPILTSLLAGLVFGIGLIVSGMANPAKVLGFLDLEGEWDPSLACVMGGAVAIGLIAFRLAGRRTVSLLGEPLRMPASSTIDRRLIVGSAVFGIGWGVAGYCPGPALASLATGEFKPLLFVLAMVAGMAVFELVGMRKRTGAPDGQP